MQTQLMYFITLIFASWAVIVFSFLIDITIVKFILALVAIFLGLLGFSMRYYSYILIPAIKSRGNKINLYDDPPYVLSPSGNVIFRREGNSVYASAFVKIPLYKSASEMNNDEKLEFAKLFSRLAIISQYPFKIVSQVYLVNTSIHKTTIINNINELEEKIANEKDERVLDRLKGALTMWHNLLDGLSKASPRDLVTFVMVSAVGGNEDEASNLAMQRAEEIASGISSLTGVNASVATRDEILLFCEPTAYVPIELITEKLRENVVV